MQKIRRKYKRCISTLRLWVSISDNKLEFVNLYLCHSFSSRGDGMGQASIRGGEQVWTKSLNIDTANEVEIVFTDVAVTYDDFGFAADGMNIDVTTNDSDINYALSGNIAKVQNDDVIDGTNTADTLFGISGNGANWVGEDTDWTIITFARSRF